MRRQTVLTLATAGALAVLAAGALVAAAPSGHAAARPSSAYGVGADGQVPVPKTPYIESKDGKQRSSSALELPKNPLLSVRAANVAAGSDSASVEILDVVVGPNILDQVKVPPELKASCAQLPDTGADDLPVPDVELPDLGLPLPLPKSVGTKDLPVKNLPELCKLLLTPPSSLLGVDAINVYCDGDKGGVDVGSLTLLGQKIDLPTSPSTSIPAAPLATITANKQTKHSDGSFTVTGLEIDLGGGAEVIRLGSVTCATPAKVVKPTPKPTPTLPLPDSDPVPHAPPAKPIETRHPVTG